MGERAGTEWENKLPPTRVLRETNTELKTPRYERIGFGSADAKPNVIIGPMICLAIGPIIDNI